MPQGHVGLVREALRERKRLFRLAPHLVRPLAFVVPLFRETHRPLGIRIPMWARPLAPAGVRIGLILYDLFSRDPGLRHRVLSPTELAAWVPDLRTDGLTAAFLYYDGLTDDVRLTHAILHTARAYGALVANYAEAVGFVRTETRIRAVGVLDRLTGRTLEVPVRWVVNATGIWADRVAALTGPPPFRIRHSKGVHLVLRPGAVQASAALVIPETDDGRLAFLVPWKDRLILGTTDEPYDQDLDAPPVTAEEVAYLLDHANRYLTVRLGPEDVTGVYAGIRPLVDDSGRPTASLSRDHVVVVSGSGLVTVTGGKLTTYRRMAQDAVDAIAREEGRRRCETGSIPLMGQEGLASVSEELGQVPFDPEQRHHLLSTYGSLARAMVELVREDPSLAARLVPEFPHPVAEVVYACRAEYALTLVDCLYLRTRLAVLDARVADRVAPSVAEWMARELGWSAAERDRQLAEYRAVRAREETWRIPEKVPVPSP